MVPQQIKVCAGRGKRPQYLPPFGLALLPGGRVSRGHTAPVLTASDPPVPQPPIPVQLSWTHAEGASTAHSVVLYPPLRTLLGRISQGGFWIPEPVWSLKPFFYFLEPALGLSQFPTAAFPQPLGLSLLPRTKLLGGTKLQRGSGGVYTARAKTLWASAWAGV